MKKTTRMITGVVLAAAVVMGVAGCTDQLSRTYYDHNPMSGTEVSTVWGNPVEVVSLAGGMEKRVYEIQNPYAGMRYRYFIIQDGMVLASGVSDSISTDGAAGSPHLDRTGFVPGDLSVAFYTRNRTTVDDLEKSWGAPVQVQPLGNEEEIRTYAIANPYTDFKFRRFIVKDGIVRASRISPSQDLPIEKHRRSGFKGVEINEVSHAYYKAHPMSLKEVEQVWGKPVSVRDAGSGMEKRYYKIKMPSDVGFEFRFFVIQDGMVVSSGISDTVAVDVN
ncbi:hypothetical protein LJC22_04040 [Desulfosarcina sp. OttesenSCG-928-G10]|nr:hypothetical protein [Desulfosarcina sp. OttesenSCG-928-G10]MDL2321155.1 hypothetical protein [Desulfosarcina sp. OttesenSCG-928-B08]